MRLGEIVEICFIRGENTMSFYNYEETPIGKDIEVLLDKVFKRL